MYQVTLITRLGRKEIFGTYATLEQAAEAANGWNGDVVDTKITRVK